MAETAGEAAAIEEEVPAETAAEADTSLLVPEGQRQCHPTFPIDINIEDSIDEGTPSAGSLMFQTLPAVFGVTDAALDILWSAFAARECGELGLDPSEWELLAQASIFPEDPLEILLSVTLGQISAAFGANPGLDKLLLEFRREIEDVLGSRVSVVGANYYEDWPILLGLVVNDCLKVFRLPRNLLRCVSVGPYKCWEDLVELSERKILSDLGLNATSIMLVSALWQLRSWIRSADERWRQAARNCPPSRSFEEMLWYAVSPIRDKRRDGERNTGIALAHLLSRNNGMTLQRLAHDSGLSRERVRQVARSVRQYFTSREFAEKVHAFWLAVFNILCAAGGAIDLEDLPVLIQASFKWDSAPEVEHLELLLELNASVVLDKDAGTLYLGSLACLECEEAKQGLLQAVESARLRTTVLELADRISTRCDASCPLSPKVFEAASPSLVNVLLQLSGSGIRIEGGNVYSPRGWAVKRGPLADALEHLLREAGRPMDRSEILLELAEIGRKQIPSRATLQNALLVADNVVRSGKDRFVHIDCLGIDEEKLAGIISYVDEMVSAKGHLSVAKVWREKRVSCRMLGICGPRLLYDVLRVFGEGEFRFPRYPVIQGGYADNGHLSLSPSLAATVCEYLRQRRTVCSFDEIQNHFARERGYSESTINALLNSNAAVVGYGCGSVVHRETIQWDANASEALAKTLSDAYAFAVGSGRFYALLSELLETEQLPSLPNGILWTSTLLANLAKELNSVRVLGTAGNAVVCWPNRFGIGSTEDLISLVLEKEWGGAANLDEFVKDLRGGGIIRRRLTSSLLNDSGRFEVIGHEIILRRRIQC